jgi:hypothetical protein
MFQVFGHDSFLLKFMISFTHAKVLLASILVHDNLGS